MIDCYSCKHLLSNAACGIKDCSNCKSTYKFSPSNDIVYYRMIISIETNTYIINGETSPYFDGPFTSFTLQNPNNSSDIRQQLCLLPYLLPPGQAHETLSRLIKLNIFL